MSKKNSVKGLPAHKFETRVSPNVQEIDVLTIAPDEMVERALAQLWAQPTQIDSVDNSWRYPPCHASSRLPGDD